jgi:hypothetical protein
LTLAVVVTAAAVTGAGAARHGTRPADRLVPASARDDALPARTTSVNPTYLPPGATPDPAFHGYPGFPDAKGAQYLLAGPANADTVPPEGFTEENNRTVHPATVLEVGFVAGMTALPSSLIQVSDSRYTVQPVQVAGLPALMTAPRNGFGTYRIDWLDAAGYHLVMCDRLDHVEGVAGLEPDELLAVARSLYA